MIEAKVQGEIGGVKVQKNYYDAEELRYQVEENRHLTQYIYNQDKQAVVEIKENKPNRIIRGDQILSSDSEKAKLYYHYMSDERGSITHIIGDAANIEGYEGLTEQITYDAFGNVYENVGRTFDKIQFGYTGERWDALTKQVYLRARFYSPAVGRFVSEDTYHGDGLNLYAYVDNNPLKYVDPTGHQKCPTLKELEKKEANRTLTKSEYKTLSSYRRRIASKTSTNTVNPNALKYNGDGTWTSNSGLIYDQGSKEGNRVLHVLEHTKPNPNKPVHTVFNVDKSNVIGLVDEAWNSRGVGNLASNGYVTYNIDMGKTIGTNGETFMRIVTNGYTNKLISAYPIP